MSAVEIVCVSVSALAVVMALALVVSSRANRRRAAELEARIGELAERVATRPAPAPPAAPAVHVLEPLDADQRHADRTVVVPSTAQVVDATLGRPIVRAVALGHGLRRALRPDSRDRIAALVRREFRRRRKLRLKAGRRAARLAVVQAGDREEPQERAS